MKGMRIAGAAALAAAALCLLPAAGKVHAAEETYDMLKYQDAWVMQKNSGEISFNKDGQMEIISVEANGFNGDNGAVYNNGRFKSAVIDFEFQVEFNEGVEPYREDMPNLPETFFGIMFLNNHSSDQPFPQMCSPWHEGAGGYPYMLCFDTEKAQAEPERATQIGMTLRRYGSLGRLNYTRWSTVDPVDKVFLSREQEEQQSLVPEYSQPVYVSDIFDEEKHAVKLDFKPLYVSQGDEYDAIEIKVWFDGEFVLHVIDEMPLVGAGEEWGVPIDIDKREGDGGYVQLFNFHDSASPSMEMYAYKLTYSKMEITARDAGGGSPQRTESERGCGCAAVSLSSGFGTGIPMVSLALAFLLAKRRMKQHAGA